MTTLYGISNCDTVRKARKWLASHDVAYQFHDFRKDGLSSKQVTAWVKAVGWEALLNRRGQTWRKLADKDKANLSEAKAIKLMASEPTLIKRPVLAVNKQVTVGFSEADYQRLFR
jgi:arsenate reductase